jgi:hypothetical protein
MGWPARRTAPVDAVGHERGAPLGGAAPRALMREVRPTAGAVGACGGGRSGFAAHPLEHDAVHLLGGPKPTPPDHVSPSVYLVFVKPWR